MGIEQFRHEGRRCVVTGAASGMGRATAELLVELGAQVYALDVKPAHVEGAQSIEVDLLEPASIDNALSAIGGEVHALCSVAGLPGEPFPDIDTISVNFLGARHLIEGAVNRGMLPRGAAIACVTSFVGRNWPAQWPTIEELVTATDYATGRAWCEAHSFGGYKASKEAMNAYVMWRNAALLKGGVRINAVAPGVTQTGMSQAFIDQRGKEFMDQFPKPIGRESTPDEQAHVLAFLCSDAASYISGALIETDGGITAGRLTNTQS